MTDNKHVKIAFEIEQDEDGWPPATTETLWAIDLGDGTYKIDNIPFFAPLLACGDIVTAERKYDDMLYYVDTVIDSEHSTIRIFFENENKIKEVYSKLEKIGCGIEGGEDYKHMTSVDVLPNTNFKEVTDYLQEMENNDYILYEESCISEYHQNQ